MTNTEITKYTRFHDIYFPFRLPDGQVVNDYKHYRDSTRWGKIRDAYEVNHPKICPCGRTTKMNLHHKTYHNLGKEKMKDLQWLCPDCHRLLHMAHKHSVTSIKHTLEKSTDIFITNIKQVCKWRKKQGWYIGEDDYWYNEHNCLQQYGIATDLSYYHICKKIVETLSGVVYEFKKPEPKKKSSSKGTKKNKCKTVKKTIDKSIISDV